MNYYDIELEILSEKKIKISKFIMKFLIKSKSKESGINEKKLLDKLIENNLIIQEGESYKINSFKNTYEKILDRYQNNIQIDYDEDKYYNLLNKINYLKNKIPTLKKKKRKDLEKKYALLLKKRKDLEGIIKNKKYEHGISIIKEFIKKVLNNDENYNNLLKKIKDYKLTQEFIEIGIINDKIKNYEQFVLPSHINGKTDYELFIKNTLIKTKMWVRDYLKDYFH